MVSTTLLSAAVVVAATACGSGSGADSSGSSPDPAGLIGKTYVSDDATNRDIPGGGPLVLTFNAGGNLSANAGCNGHGGDVTFTGDTMTAGPLMGTMMACPPPRDTIDKWVSTLFTGPLQWSLSGRTLKLTRDDLTVTLNQRVDRAVAGTTWRVTALVRDRAVSRSAAIERAKPTVTIGADATLRGWTGCNNMHGEATVTRDGESQIVETGPIATTRKACGPEIGEIERTILDVLDGGAIAEVDGDELRLTNRKDPSIGLRLTTSPASGK